MAEGRSTARRRRGGRAEANNVANRTPQPTSTASNGANGRDGNGIDRQQQPNLRDAVRQALMRTLLMYVMYQYYLKKPSGSTENSSTNVPAQAPASSLASLLIGASKDPPRYYFSKLDSALPIGSSLEFRVYTSLDPNMTFHKASSLGAGQAIWIGQNLKFDTVKESDLAMNVTLKVPDAVRMENATWYSHVFVGFRGIWDVDEPLDQHVSENILYSRHEIIGWRKVDLNKKGKNLLGVDEDEEDSNEDNRSGSADQEESGLDDESKEMDGNKLLVRYDQVWKPTMPIIIVTEKSQIILSQLPASASSSFRVHKSHKQYYPPMHVNEFWMLQDSLRLMNNSVKEVQLEMSFSPVSLYKWCMYKQFDALWQKQIDFGTMKPNEPDNMKRVFLETNPWLLGLTMFVSTAHTVLETLAFKNDISHWKNIKSMEGVSIRSMIWKIVMEAIIFLYLWDNDTSWMITIGNGIGVAIAIWKLGKAVKFENFGKRKLLGFIPWFDIVDRESYSKETKEYDDQAMRYLGYALYPLVVCYALYSLKYEKHKSWYSWVVNSLVGAVYAFGFIMMFPQIFINYKLKSVAHLPMKAMMYKTLNTVIDDLFSFIIKMPWLHRIACFRDDVVFLVILYQRWIYPTDKKRVNEFGQQFDEDGEEKAPASRENAPDHEQETSKVGSGGTRVEKIEKNSADNAEEKGIDEKKND